MSPKSIFALCLCASFAPALRAQEVALDSLLHLTPAASTLDSVNAALHVADSLRAVAVADSLRQAFVADSLVHAYTLNAVRMDRQMRATLKSGMMEWLGQEDLSADTLSTTTEDSNVRFAQWDYRLPVIISPCPKVTPLPAVDIAAQQPTPRRRQEVKTKTAFDQQVEYADSRQQTLNDYFHQNPFNVHYLRGSMNKAPEKQQLERESLLRGTQIDVVGGDIVYIPLKAGKVSADKWHYHGYSTYQMTQTALSDNWYKGGENNATIYSDQKLQIKRYDENKITTFEATVQLKLGFYYTQADTVHSMRVNDNQFSIDVKYGYKAWKRWYYSTSMNFKTPIFNYYPANSKTVKSAFLSPAELNVNIGMDYTYDNKAKTVSYSLLLAPLSYYMKYVHNQNVSVTQYGIDADHRVLNQLGSSLTSKLAWKISNSVQWASRLYVFTSYHSLLGEFENTFTFRVNRYLSANIMLYPRIDDDTNKDPWQMKEMLTFGFNYVWK
jgi:hypothetical protein